MIEATEGNHYMNCKILKSWLTGILPIKTRIQTVCIAYILFLMVGLRNKKHYLKHQGFQDYMNLNSVDFYQSILILPLRHY
ncbi:MAG: hypothetical protein OMM_11198 [Candidatus Magnetoglobus multicellularis str. Araruama]|uniref:Uncharacterized protein n=1 Tax=Candidatus Magnetoglobus multicellularis str. Araruama TaxID=890399 RepID=A0A1V1NYZ5_9BACT|nr:MAG: hypothetical protein OMM_11198 [Candidatus Magnetoglobus multicellularis str. Araruama]